MVNSFKYYCFVLFTMKPTNHLWKTGLVLGFVVFLLICNVATASELSMSSFNTNKSSSNPLDGLGDGKPMMLEAIVTVVAFFVASCFLGIFGSGTTANIGNLIHSASLRKGGLAGIVLVIVVVVVVAIAVIYTFHVYNKYIGPGL